MWEIHRIRQRIDIFIDRCFGPNFDPKSERDKEFIDRVHAEDEAAIVGGKLTPTHMLPYLLKKCMCRRTIRAGSPHVVRQDRQ